MSEIAKQLAPSLRHLGAAVVEVRKRSETNTQVLLRVGPDRAAHWPEFIAELLSTDTEVALDVSKVFFKDAGTVKYLWRIVIAGDLEVGLRDIAAAANSVVGRHSQVDEVQLLGVTPRNAFAAKDGRAEALIAPHFAALGGSQ